MPLSLIIPAYQPPPSLLAYVKGLAAKPFSKLIVLDDGSGPSYAPLFRKIAQIKKVVVLSHAVNLGKGAALKSALNHWYCSFPKDEGVICADADGQHHIKDVLKLSKAQRKSPHSLLLGVRSFHTKVPLRSRLGNFLTKYLFYVLVGRKITDTQTGLRAIPRHFVPQLLKIKGNNYEFELEALIQSKYFRIPILEIPIQTVYFEQNKASHFNPFLDSMRIYYVLLRSAIASFSTAILDNLLFIFSMSFFNSLAYSQTSARIGSTIYSFFLIRSFVFLSKKRWIKNFGKYLLLTILSGFVSYAFILFLKDYFGLHTIAAKILAESLIYLANFTIQRDFIFSDSDDSTESAMEGYEFLADDGKAQ